MLIPPANPLGNRDIAMFASYSTRHSTSTVFIKLRGIPLPDLPQGFSPPEMVCKHLSSVPELAPTNAPGQRGLTGPQRGYAPCRDDPGRGCKPCLTCCVVTFLVEFPARDADFTAPPLALRLRVVLAIRIG